MKKRHSLLVIILVFVLSNALYASTLPVVVENNTTFVPLRFLSETLGYEVIWTNDLAPIIIKNGSTTLKFSLGSNKIDVNGKTIVVPTKIKQLGGTTMVPLRVFSENLGTTTLFENNVLYLSNDRFYWIWELDDGKTPLQSLKPQKFFPDNELSIYSQITVDKLLNLSVEHLKKSFPGALKIPGTTNYIAYINPNAPNESTLTFHYDYEHGPKPFCITLGQAPQSDVDIFGFNYVDQFTPTDVIPKLGDPLSTQTLSKDLTSHLFKVGSHYLNFTFSNSSTSSKTPTLYYIDLYASTYFSK